MSILDYNQPATKAKLMRGEPVPWIDRNQRSGYIWQAILSFPLWVNRSDLFEIWKDCRMMEKLTGEKYSIDHIIPLNHPYVCGLTVPWNLRIVPCSVNNAKCNKWNPHQQEIELIVHAEQMRLI